MKTICISIALFFTVVITANAQEQLNQRGNRRPVLVDDIRGERLINIRQNSFSFDNLGLSNEQQAEITKLQAEKIRLRL